MYAKINKIIYVIQLKIKYYMDNLVLIKILEK